MDEEVFDEKIEGREEKFVRNDVEESGVSTENVYEYRPYDECPHCSEYAVRMYVREEREEISRIFRTTKHTDWEITAKWRHCENCKFHEDIVGTA